MNSVNTGIGLNKITLVVKLVGGVKFPRVRKTRWSSITNKTTRTKLDIDLSIFVGVVTDTKSHEY